MSSLSVQSPLAQNQELLSLPLVRINDDNFTAQDLLVILNQQGLMSSVVRSVLVERAIAAYEPTLEQQTAAYQRLRDRYQLTSEKDYHNWLSQNGLTPLKFYQLAIRTWRIEQFKRQEFGCQLHNYFMERKRDLDRVVYSLIRTRNANLAAELYHRIAEGENTFAELAVRYSEGEEIYTNGLIGPVEMGQVNHLVARNLRSAKLNQVLLPMQLGEWWVIVRLEQFLPVSLDETMEARLLDELFELWLSERLNKSDLSIVAG